METVGQYQLLRSIGKGGMGEVFLAHDPRCDRKVALKRIRPDLLKHTIIKERFLREARIAAQLTHPSIIPIYEIVQDKEQLFYTMPYVEGETLKEILKTTKEQEAKGKIIHPIGGSIPSLLRIFFSVCQAIHYTHSKKILHRDLKPDNIIVGKYGEVLILDWGLADFTNNLRLEKPEDGSEIETEESPDFTKPGKIVGTLAYMPPERAHGTLASETTDIYALGTILYQILTLKLPFHRPTLKAFQKQIHHERLLEPEEVAPYRDIPRYLADIAKKCLAPSPDQRYRTVAALLSDLENFIEGRPEWVPIAKLSLKRKKDWAFAENVLFAKYMAITRGTDVAEWVDLRISKSSFSESTRLEMEVELGPTSHGIGFLAGIQEPFPSGLDKCYLLWLGNKEAGGSKLILHGIEVMPLHDVILSPGEKYKIRIEKTNQNFRFFLNGELRCNFLTHTPITGTYAGLLLRDDDIRFDEMAVYAGSLNATVNCLAIPDAFLTHGDFGKALAEYRRLADAFAGRAEGREALFRSGITLLEQGKREKKKKNQQKFFSSALEEFNKLRNTPGGPLEFLGKSLVYQAKGDLEEESKCIELAIRKFRMHPLFSLLSEHIVFRLHETSASDRTAAYTFALLAIRHLPEIFSNPDNSNLLKNLKAHLEPLPFLNSTGTMVDLTLELAFWLNKPLLIEEILEKTTITPQEKENGLNCLFELGEFKLLKKHKEIAFSPPLSTAKKIGNALKQSPTRNIWSICQIALDKNLPDLVIPYAKGAQLIWAYLLMKNWKEARKLFEAYSDEDLLIENSPLFFLFGCYLRAVEGKEIAAAYLNHASDHPYPPTTALLSAYLAKKISSQTLLFFWEKKQLHRELTLFYRCAKDLRRAKLSQRKIG